MKIVLDTVPLIYSRGADRRTTFHLYRELLALDREDDFSFLCIDRLRRRSTYEPLLAIRDLPVREVRVPFRAIEWTWKHLHWPALERLMGQVDLYHVAGTHAPPAREARPTVVPESCSGIERTRAPSWNVPDIEAVS